MCSISCLDDFIGHSTAMTKRKLLHLGLQKSKLMLASTKIFFAKSKQNHEEFSQEPFTEKYVLIWLRLGWKQLLHPNFKSTWRVTCIFLLPHENNCSTGKTWERCFFLLQYSLCSHKAQRPISGTIWLASKWFRWGFVGHQIHMQNIVLLFPAVTCPE